MKPIISVAVALCFCLSLSATSLDSLPGTMLRIGGDSHYFVDAEGKPLFMLGDTQWELFREFSLDDLATYFSIRKKQGFSFVQVFVTGVFPESDSFRTIPFSPSRMAWKGGDPLRPDEEYFARVDSIVKLAEQNGFVLVVGVYHTKDQQNGRITKANARAWARWLATRYRDARNIAWSMYPNAGKHSVDILKETMVGLAEGDGGNHLVTIHPDPGPNSASYFDGLVNYSFNTIQSFSTGFVNYTTVRKDYAMVPAMPVINGEARYEGEAKTTAFDIRRSAYWSVLAGGGYCYGHGNNWMKPMPWKEWVESEGADQMRVLHDFFAGLEWWNLRPVDGTITGKENVVAEAAESGWLVAYIVEKGEQKIDFGEGISLDAEVWRVDPRTGERTSLGKVGSGGDFKCALPAGWEDMLLLVR